MTSLLFAWIGDTDLRAPLPDTKTGIGPIANALEHRKFDRVLLLTDRDPSRAHRVGNPKVEVRVDTYFEWLKSRSPTPIEMRHAPLTSPTSYREIYEAARAWVDEARADGATLTFHVSPGTPAMGAVWLLLAKTYVPATLLESSIEGGVHDVDLPFRIAAEFLPDALREHDERLRQAASAPTPAWAEFANIVHKSDVMKQVIARARRVAIRDVPVLILGESGTGKELFAKAIHASSGRAREPFIAINCGAIPENLIESELFGHVKGAFTGADRDRKGHFEQAHGGTLFLDEIGELSPTVQVRLLRVLQQNEVVRVGSSDTRKVDVRVLAATHRDLTDAIDHGRFREDLFYRLAVAVLQLPPLRDRGKDRELLLTHLLDVVNKTFSTDPGFVAKHLTPEARAVFLGHSWPGNVREMLNTLQRAALWSDGKFITDRDARESLIARKSASPDLLNRPLGDGFDIREIVALLERTYLERAVRESGGTKKKAAELLGLQNTTTLTNWMERHHIVMPKS